MAKSKGTANMKALIGNFLVKMTLLLGVIGATIGVGSIYQEIKNGQSKIVVNPFPSPQVLPAATVQPSSKPGAGSKKRLD